MDAFATYQDLEARLNRVFSVEEQDWITTLLEDASTYLREDVIGFQVFPQSTVTFDAWPSNGEVVLPQQPAQSVGAVTVGVTPISFVLRDGSVFVDTRDEVTVTFTYGYAAAPEGLKRWACVLVSQALVPLELNLGLTVGGLSSVALDDFKAAFADGGEGTGMSLSDRNIALIRRQYSSDVHVGGMR
ncbi:hypothetical protein [Agromyces cerinus]|uniref:Uncharacterized protein n=1 Tax=Agromyces cerinus subsp. cerinus TaxID=232089 RepID=A0A1N6DPT5_9MICO|nr:hypothetical protein [Agromyces cerinus]SIN72819.1 hypothetical protein SAMN05443544_0576 [Agromyces cerinus subsp. cerinus]